MYWCSSCVKYVIRPGIEDGKISCPVCGRVIDEDNFSQEPTFYKNASGQSQMSGTHVKTVQSEYPISRERTLKEASTGMEHIMLALGIDVKDPILITAMRFYMIALERNFTRGRRKDQVQAACLYIACRGDRYEDKKPKPFLLIDFSQLLRINVYVLGAVFLQLCQLLSLHEHPFLQNLVDPSLFIHRFTERLFSRETFGDKKKVTEIALLIVASMKRDWMQTGRKPSGLCGAAIYISALAHGLKCSKSEIIKVVRVCEATLSRRLIEFENTESASLTIDEFKQKAEERKKDEMLTNESFLNKSSLSKLLCKHKGSGIHGLCQECYKEFIKFSGGFDGGSEPPAFQRAAARERRRTTNVEEDFSVLPQQKDETVGEQTNASENKKSQLAAAAAAADVAGAISKQHKNTEHNNDDDPPVDATFVEESESLSDIDDTEVDIYLHDEEEKKLKTIIWEEMNKEYLQEQAAKEAIALAAKKAYEGDDCSEDVRAAKELAARAEAAAEKSKKERREKRAAEMKNSVPAQTAAEATKQMLDRKRLSSKIRYDVLEKLFDDSEFTKKSRTETEKDQDDNYLKISKDDPAIEFEDVEDTIHENVDEYYEDDEDYNFDDSSFF